MMTEKDLIQKLQGLKQIKPSQDWVVLTKSEIFSNTVAPYGAPQKAVFTNIFGVIFQKKLAYSLAVLLMAFVGGFGVMKYGFLVSNNNVAVQSPEILASIQSNVEQFKVKSQTLAEATKDQVNVSVALNEVKNVAKELTSAIKKDPQLAKKVALDINNNKTLLDISGSNSVNEVSNMYETIVVSLIKDLDERTLSQDQDQELKRIKKYLKDSEDYTVALRDILLISQVSETE